MFDSVASWLAGATRRSWVPAGSVNCPVFQVTAAIVPAALKVICPTSVKIPLITAWTEKAAEFVAATPAVTMSPGSRLTKVMSFAKTPVPMICAAPGRPLIEKPKPWTVEPAAACCFDAMPNA